MKKNNKRFLAFMLATVMLLGVYTPVSALSEPEQSPAGDPPKTASDFGPFIYNGQIGDAKSWSSSYRMNVPSKMTIKYILTANPPATVVLDVEDANGNPVITSTGTLSAGGPSGATFTLGTLSAGTYFYRYMFTNGSGMYVLQITQ